jgi:hypothetical protein
MRTATLLVFLCLLCSLVGGCAGQDQRTSLRYIPSPAAPSRGEAVAVAMPSEAHGLAVAKTGQPIIGDVVTNTGRKTASVLVTDPIPQWVAAAVVGELKAQGVNAGLNLQPKAGRAVVKTEISRLKTETKSQWSSSAVVSTIGLDFIVERDGQQLGAYQAAGTAKVEGARKMTDNMKESLERALRDAMKKAAPELAKMLR